jgi:hypothetical protein
VLFPVVRFERGGPVVAVDSGIRATISDLTVSNGVDAAGNGGGISNAGTLTLTDVVVSDNAATFGENGIGGGIFNAGTLSVSHSFITHNQADGLGGREAELQTEGHSPSLTAPSPASAQTVGPVVILGIPGAGRVRYCGAILNTIAGRRGLSAPRGRRGYNALYALVIDRLTERPAVADVRTSVVYEHLRKFVIEPFGRAESSRLTCRDGGRLIPGVDTLSRCHRRRSPGSELTSCSLTRRMQWRASESHPLGRPCCQC